MTGRDTIFALSSGHGRAGIAVVRISGPGARGIVEGLAGTLPAPRVAQLANLRDPASGEVLDRGMVLWFPGPASATGEDVAEFHLHGSPAVVAALFRVLEKFNGLRPAEAGEFSKRAFLNSKMDLVEAEGLADLLAARTDVQRRQAMFQLVGNASSVFEAWRGRMIRSLALVEAAVDFSEEEDVAAAALDQARPEIRALLVGMEQALAQAHSGEVIRDGVRVVLAGLPNTGKSSLLNAMAKRDAAIVSSIPGTTRDVIEVSFDLMGIPVTLCDTAGLREVAADAVESIGIERSWQNLRAADVIIWVSAPDVVDSIVIPDGVKVDVFVANKSDLGDGVLPVNAIRVSSRDGGSVSALLEALGAVVRARFGQGERGLIVRARQRAAVANSIRHLNDSLQHPVGRAELVAEELRAAAMELGRLTGAIDVEDLLGSIFSEFCIGK